MVRLRRLLKKTSYSILIIHYNYILHIIIFIYHYNSKTYSQVLKGREFVSFNNWVLWNWVSWRIKVQIKDPLRSKKFHTDNESKCSTYQIILVTFFTFFMRVLLLIEKFLHINHSITSYIFNSFQGIEST